MMNINHDLNLITYLVIKIPHQLLGLLERKLELRMDIELYSCNCGQRAHMRCCVNATITNFNVNNISLRRYKGFDSTKAIYLDERKFFYYIIKKYYKR